MLYCGARLNPRSSVLQDLAIGHEFQQKGAAWLAFSASLVLNKLLHTLRAIRNTGQWDDAAFILLQCPSVVDSAFPHESGMVAHVVIGGSDSWTGKATKSVPFEFGFLLHPFSGDCSAYGARPASVGGIGAFLHPRALKAALLLS